MDDLTRLLTRARDGDRIALGGWIRGSQADVWRLCAALVDRASADDLTQETFLRAFRALPSFRAESSSRTWLLSIARRTCADELRARSRRPRILRPPAPEDVRVPAATGHVDAMALVTDLPPDQREAFTLTQLLGLSYAEAAETIGVAVGTIRSRVARGRAAIAASLAAEDGQAPAGTST